MSWTPCAVRPLPACSGRDGRALKQTAPFQRIVIKLGTSVLTAGTPSDLIAYTNPYDLCLGCHVHAPGPGRNGTGDFVATLVGR